MPYSPLASEAGLIHVCAHRGHSIAAPENTIPAFQAAVDVGATVLEIDVVLTRDEEIVLMHDEILDRTTNGKGRVADHDLAAIRKLDAGAWFGPEFAGTRVPTLAETIDFARDTSVGLLIEIKERQQPGQDSRAARRPARDSDAEGDVLVISFDHVSLLRLREAFPATPHRAHHACAPCRHRRRRPTRGAASVSIEWNMFHPDDARALHAAGIGVRVSMPRPERLARAPRLRLRRRGEGRRTISAPA